MFVFNFFTRYDNDDASDARNGRKKRVHSRPSVLVPPHTKAGEKSECFI